MTDTENTNNTTGTVDYLIGDILVETTTSENSTEALAEYISRINEANA